jgi:hypothetical protein
LYTDPPGFPDLSSLHPHARYNVLEVKSAYADHTDASTEER